MNPKMAILRKRAMALPLLPGVYIMHSADGEIIYIGKAKALRNRVSQYFGSQNNHAEKVRRMVDNVDHFEYIITDSEFEALILECSLIKQHTPKYNILLKDDKGYSYIKVSGDKWRKISYVLQKNDDNAEYIGPYKSSYYVKSAVEEANKIFMLPTCNRKFPQDFGKGRPCLNYHIKTCMGLCRGYISEKNYNATIKQAVEFIKNGSTESVERMESEMNAAAEALDFEKAAMLRDRIAAMKKASEKQKIINNGVETADIIASAEFYDGIYISVLMYRAGRLYDKAVYEFDIPDSGEDILTRFMTQFYYGKSGIPRNIIIERIPADEELISEFLERQSLHKVTLHVPQKGRQAELLRLAKNNSAEYAALKNDRTGKEIIALEELGRSLGLEKPPKYIEAYDISNLSSESMVAGMVVFEDGRPLKKAYKRFSVKQQEHQNDYGSMQEVIRRRLMHIVSGEGDEYFTRIPDLILLDGGKGHVNAVAPILRELGLNIPLFGMVKDNKHRTRAIATGGKEIQINGLKAAFNLVTRIQDEVHRYSVSYMHSKHKKKTYASELTTVKGVGEKKAAKLMIAYKTKEKLREATPEQLASVAGVNADVAQELWELIRSM